ncbi:MAG: TlpA disulfide reductase family protein [Bacteroidota bacterium]|nr:TlpA disulfide reductase family protein [Bacteroidota bacterium]
MIKHKIFALLLMIIVLASCSKQSEISINIPELSEAEVVVTYADLHDLDNITEFEVKKGQIKSGRFSFSLSVDSIDKRVEKYLDCTVNILNKEKRFMISLPLPIEKSKNLVLTITGLKEYINGVSPVKVSYGGSKSAEDFSNFLNNVNKQLAKIRLQNEDNKAYSQIVSLCEDFSKQYKESAFPYTIIMSLLANIDTEDNPIMKYCEKISTQTSDNQWQNYCILRYKNKILKQVSSKVMLFNAEDYQGNRYTNNDFLGKITLLHFWSVKGVNCLASLKDVKQFYEKYSPKGLQVLSISIDPLPNDWLKWSKENNLQWTSLFANGEVITNRYSFNDIPMYMLFDKEGKLINKSNNLSDLIPQVESNLE